MVVAVDYLAEILAHLEVVQQLALQIRAEGDEAERELDRSTGKLLDHIVKAVAPILVYLDKVRFKVRPDFDREVLCEGVELTVPEFRLRYHGGQRFNKVTITAKGELVTWGARMTPSASWYFLTYGVVAAPIERLNFVIIFVGSLIGLLKENLPKLEQGSREIEAAQKWVDTALGLLRQQAPN